MARSRRDVFGSRTTSMVARILACLGFEPGRWAIRHAYALATTRRVAVSQTRGATWCCLGTGGRRLDIYTTVVGEPPAPWMTRNTRDA